MKIFPKISLILTSGLTVFSCSPQDNSSNQSRLSSSESTSQLDRSHLPIQPPEVAAVTELDARNVKVGRRYRWPPL